MTESAPFTRLQDLSRMSLRERTRPGLGMIEVSSTCSRAHSCVIDQGAGSDTIVPGPVLNLIATCRRAPSA
jgi:hypothetical protein